MSSASHIGDLAAVLRKQLGLFPPINLDLTCRILGVNVDFVEFGRELSGLCVTTPSGNTYIALNSTMPEPRIRFTWAHELGHYLLSEKPPGSISVHFLRGSSGEERDCDMFAAELLMPAKLIASRLSNLRELNIQNRLIGLCATFGVSRWAMLRRIEELGLKL